MLGPPDQGIPLTFIDTETGEQLEDLGPKTVEAGVIYRRDKKPKIITRFPTSAKTAGIHPNEDLLNYDHVFAVDTNTDQLTGKSVTVALWLRGLRHEPDGWKIEPRYPPAYVFRGSSGPAPNPEKIGWRNTIERIVRSPDCKGRVALFVDSCLGELPAINARERPIVEDFMLPDRITLLFATSDAGVEEFVGSLAIKLCDGVATRLMKLSQMPGDAGQSFYLPVPVEALDDESRAAARAAKARG